MNQSNNTPGQVNVTDIKFILITDRDNVPDTVEMTSNLFGYDLDYSNLPLSTIQHLLNQLRALELSLLPTSTYQNRMSPVT